MEFNLLERCWLPVLPMDGGSIVHVSLSEALLHGGNYRRLVGESPTMTAALHRLLIALVSRVYCPLDADGWRDLWESGQEERGFPAPELTKYRERWESRFDLFDAEFPFFQCRALASPPGGSSGKERLQPHSTAELVPHRASGSNRTLFDHTTSDKRPRLEPAEAARWLVTLQMYDKGGTQTPYSSVKKSVRGLGNRFGCVLVEGRDLHETLLLNTVPYYPADELPVGTRVHDCPLWEADAPPSPEPQERHQQGWTDALTWPARRVLLFLAEDELPAGGEECSPVVDGVLITPGVELKSELTDYVELMAAFEQRLGRNNTFESKKLPVQLERLRGVWRHAQEMLLPAEARWHVSYRQRDSGSVDFPLAQAATRTARRPAALENIADQEDIEDEAVLTLRVFGQELDEKGGGSVHAWYEEAVPAPVSLLRADDPRLGGLLGHAVAYAADLGATLRELQRHYREVFAPRRAGPGSAKPRGEKMPTAVELGYWPRLSSEFADVLRQLGSCSRTARELHAVAERWGDYAQRTARRAAAEWAEGEPRSDRLLLEAAACYEEFVRETGKLGRRYRDGVAGVLGRPEDEDPHEGQDDEETD